MNCTNCGGRMGKTAAFCPKCGTPQVAEDAISAVSGAADVEADSSEVVGAGVDEAIVEPALDESADAAGTGTDAQPAARPNPVGAFISRFLTDKRKVIAAAAALFVVVVAVAGIMFTANAQANQKRQATAAAQAAQAASRLNSSFDALMGLRGHVLADEAAIQDAFDRANTKSKAYLKSVKDRGKKATSATKAYKKRLAQVRAHNAYEDRKHEDSYYNYYIGYSNYYGYSYLQKYWVAPSKPKAPGKVSAPSLSNESSATRVAVADLTAVVATLTANPADPKLASFASQLVAIAKPMSDEAIHNADVMAAAVSGETKFNTHSLSAMHTGSATALLTALNDAAIGFINTRRLDIRVYDVAGGRDSSPSDSSMLTSAN